MHNCNWKMLVENVTDTCHPMVTHESSAGTAVARFPPSNTIASEYLAIRSIPKGTSKLWSR
jgi:phenylpropionate dioxygenase-like ring-hydroxylating dioxygenase large terminal subunit